MFFSRRNKISKEFNDLISSEKVLSRLIDIIEGDADTNRLSIGQDVYEVLVVPNDFPKEN